MMEYWVKMKVILLVGVVLGAGLFINVSPASSNPPTSDEVLEAHQKLMKKYGLENRDNREMKEEKTRGYSIRDRDREERGNSKTSEKEISFSEWLKGLSLPTILIILAILIIIFYFTFRGVPGFFRRAVDTTSAGKTTVKDDDRDEEDPLADRGYHRALELAKKGEYGKALIVLHKSSVKKLRENHWIPLGKNFTNNDIRRLLRDSDPGLSIFTPFSHLAAAAERAAFRNENPGQEAYIKLKQIYETAFLKMQARKRL